jgi:carbamoyl-phosphate synthase large subunit
MSEVRILFLGAGKRLSLLECFSRSADHETLTLRMYSAETSTKVPISTVATIFESPQFNDVQFRPWLLTFVSRHKIDIVIPNMDAATVALSSISNELQSQNIWPVVSSNALCTIMEDKVAAEEWFKQQGIRVPNKVAWPRLFKHRLGFGGRGQFRVRDETERAKLLQSLDVSDYLEQEFVSGPEFSVDAYVDRLGRYIGCMPRQRLKVVDGEVDESLSVKHEKIECLTKRIFTTGGWQGPLTAQYIDVDDEPVIVEVNPRFGGGVTHSIYCGLDFPRWIMREWLRRPISAEPSWMTGSLMTRCRRDIFL